MKKIQSLILIVVITASLIGTKLVAKKSPAQNTLQITVGAAIYMDGQGAGGWADGAAVIGSIGIYGVYGLSAGPIGWALMGGIAL